MKFSISRCRRVQADFSRGSISLHEGTLLLREAYCRLKLTARVARRLGDGRQRGKVRHEVATMVRQRVHGIALGHEDLNDHDALREDLVIQTACGRDGGRKGPFRQLIVHIRHQQQHLVRFVVVEHRRRPALSLGSCLSIVVSFPAA